MPTEFLMETIAKNELNPAGDPSRDSVRLRMAYDGSGRRVSKTRERKTETGDWVRERVTHYTGIGTEVRESYSEGTINETKVVANMPNGLGRYGIENATAQNVASDFEWYLKNHLGSTMLVYATGVSADGSIKAAYDYRAFGEQVDLAVPAEKVTENFTGKERDDETELNYFGARYLDPMIGLWISVDPLREFHSGYAYGPANPTNGFDSDGAIWKTIGKPYYTNVTGSIFYNVPAILERGSTVYGKTTVTLNIDNTQDLRIRNVVQEWIYDPKASAEENARHNYGARRIIQQVQVPKIVEIDDFMRRRNESTIPLYNTQAKTGWMPFVFDEEPLEMYDFPVNENTYEPNGDVNVGDILECDNCSL